VSFVSCSSEMSGRTMVREMLESKKGAGGGLIVCTYIWQTLAGYNTEWTS
jgi:hypothetical protein